MKFKVGDRVKFIGPQKIYEGVDEGVVVDVDWELPFPVIVSFALFGMGDCPCLEKELELVE